MSLFIKDENDIYVALAGSSDSDLESVPRPNQNGSARSSQTKHGVDDWFQRSDQQKADARRNLAFTIEVCRRYVFSDGEGLNDTWDKGSRSVADELRESQQRSGVPLIELGPERINDYARTVKAFKLKELMKVFHETEAALSHGQRYLKEEVAKEKDNLSNELLVVDGIAEFEYMVKKLSAKIEELKRICPSRPGIESVTILTSLYCTEQSNANNTQNGSSQ